MLEGVIGLDDPRAPDVLALLGCHLAFANRHTPPEDIHALDVEGLLDPAIMFFSFRSDGSVVAVGALKRLDGEQAELKSMHTAQQARGVGIGRAMVTHLLEVARAAGYRAVLLETGSTDAFAPARALYASVGFTDCGPFGDYRPSRNSAFMRLSLDV